MTDLSFTHQIVAATKPGLRPLLLLHGTGGDQNDLIPLGQRLAPGAALLSPLGKVRENGMPRFFRRLAEGRFDEADLKARTLELADFVAEARKAYRLDAPVAAGFSNGANIAAALLFMRPETLAGAILMRAMLPFAPQPLPALRAKPVLLLSGATDPMMPQASRDRLAATLTQAGADLSDYTVPAGHNLTQQDLTLSAAWLQKYGRSN